MKKIKLYSIFQRFSHWFQFLLILVLAITGFEIHGNFILLGFSGAVKLHNLAALIIIILYLFIFFWFATTGEWKQYILTKDKLYAMIMYYAKGIFKNEPHPVKKTELSKLNPLQRITYFTFRFILIPLMVVTGIIYFFASINMGVKVNPVKSISIIHTIGAFVIVSFVIIHVYMTTTGHTIFSNIKAMITGVEEIPEEED
ncbi:MAG: cytochrome b/b6 domain-containing protein [Candidatus Aminicenantes bacterium]|nr:cytochrome b/b6 domain-containing protein [Candidatus Aminicenantes bacterium]